MKIAIIGSGVSGLTAAYVLAKEHDIHLYEKNDYIGGHTHTIPVDVEGTTLPVDTGFIVMNLRTYPNLVRLFDRLGVKLRNSDMSFGYFCEISGIGYCSYGLPGYFNKFRNLFDGRYYKILGDMLRFHRSAKKDLAAGTIGTVTLGEYLRANNYSELFIDHHIIPMGSAVWSTPTGTMLEFPALSFLRFLNNHGLLSLTEAPRWKTVVGGSFDYVKKILATLKGEVFTQRAVSKILRGDTTVEVIDQTGHSEHYDKVIIATHADEAFKLLGDPSDDEKRLLSVWEYNKNHTILHSDSCVMPANRRIWASWNFVREKTPDQKSSLCLSYHMNNLQGFKTKRNFFVTLNTTREVKPDTIIQQMEYEHPKFTIASMDTQKELAKLNGKRNTYFCGSYFKYGFHEDAATSALEVVKLFGMDL